MRDVSDLVASGFFTVSELIALGFVLFSPWSPIMIIALYYWQHRHGEGK